MLFEKKHYVVGFPKIEDFRMGSSMIHNVDYTDNYGIGEYWIVSFDMRVGDFKKLVNELKENNVEYKVF